ncbi:hypothetical protein [Nocardioides pocheonensis]|uniref:Uncharacterized protein n=1 Tax=Nocardioides pocheonensis TaxID=661485 RepID=A0A3N0GNA2_9ACTN|nr:hypothetical protein [Nocardioides pocheonensis]RNM13955.1 hypothetical protein EFL26_13480 [Nocardioides pocheonensis]
MIEIASKLWYDGDALYVIHPTRHQQLVDLQWAAHRAGSLLGVRVEVQVTPMGRADPRATVSITFEDPDGRVREGAEEGLEELLRETRDQQH